MEQILDAPIEEQQAIRYAGFWIRTGAYLIDIVLIGAAVVCTFLIFSSFGADPLWYLVGLPLPLVYFVWLECSERQATLGKMAVGIAIGDQYGNRIGLGRSIGRNFGRLISSNFFGMGYLMVIWDKEKQSLHDKMAGTYVFYVKK